MHVHMKSPILHYHLKNCAKMASDAVEIILDEEKKFIFWKVLTEELELANFLSGCSSLGYSKAKKTSYWDCKESCRQKRHWFTYFNELVEIIPKSAQGLKLWETECLSHARMIGGSASMIDTCSYFDLLEKTIFEAELGDQPCQIFNLDETGFP